MGIRVWMYHWVHDATPTHQPRLRLHCRRRTLSRDRFYVGYVPGLCGAHSQAETLEELNANLREMISLILEDGPPPITG